MKKAMTIITLALLLAASASGFELGSGRRAASGGAALLSIPAAGDIVDYAGLQIERNSLAIESGYERKFELSDLDRIYVAAGYRLANFSIGAGVSQLGKDDYYVERVNKGSLSYHLNVVSLGIVISGKSLEIGEGYGSFSAFAIGAGGAFKYQYLKLAVSVDNINRPRLDENVPKENMLTSFLAEITASPKVSLLGRMVLEKSEKPRLALAQYIRVTESNALVWNITGNPLTYGGGVDIGYAGFSINYAASYHPTLGFTHNISLGYNFQPEKAVAE